MKITGRVYTPTGRPYEMMELTFEVEVDTSKGIPEDVSTFISGLRDRMSREADLLYQSKKNYPSITINGVNWWYDQVKGDWRYEPRIESALKKDDKVQNSKGA